MLPFFIFDDAQRQTALSLHLFQKACTSSIIFKKFRLETFVHRIYHHQFFSII